MFDCSRVELVLSLKLMLQIKKNTVVLKLFSTFKQMRRTPYSRYKALIQHLMLSLRGGFWRLSLYFDIYFIFQKYHDQ